MYPRYIKERIKQALEDTPVVMLVGPRQCGKTTLVKILASKCASYFTFDDPAQFETARLDPVGFIRNAVGEQIIIDEVQRLPEILIAIKQSVDESRKAGQYLLTGSANVLLLPQVSESLAGRLEIIPLYPLAENELRNTDANFLKILFAGKAPIAQETRIKNLLINKVVSGGYPEPLTRSREDRRMNWYLHYIDSLIQKDLTEIANIEHLRVMPKYLRILGNTSAQLINFTKLGENLELSRQTTARYLQLLERLFLVELLPAWHRNENKQLTKTPKIHFLDTGLLCALRRINSNKLAKDLILFGHLLETYVFSELKKQASWLSPAISFFHYRDTDKCEVDFVLESANGEIIGIEVKAAATLKKTDFNGLIRLKEMAKEDFCIGILLYDGDVTTAFGDKLYAVPLAALWGAKVTEKSI